LKVFIAIVLNYKCFFVYPKLLARIFLVKQFVVERFFSMYSRAGFALSFGDAKQAVREIMVLMKMEVWRKIFFIFMYKE